MQIEGTNKLLIIKVVDGDSAILITHINSIMSGLDNPNVDVAFILIQILEGFPGLEGNNSDVLVDSSDDDFAYIKR